MKVQKKKLEIVNYKCIIANQGVNTLVGFTIKASELWNIVEINKREPDKNKGYQRTLSLKRVESIARYIKKGNPIPLSILISFDHAQIDKTKRTITIPNKKNAGWVIDGQHRLAGAHESNTNIELFVIAFISLPLENQVKEFITINKEAKGVPSSLYLDLLKRLPKDKTEKELLQERATNISDALRKDEDSPFFNKIVIMSSPKKGEISLTNFVRKITPLIQKNGKLSLYTIEEQVTIINNYYIALNKVFPQYFLDEEPVLLQTIGFGAVLNFFPTVFDICIKLQHGFAIKDIVIILKNIEDFDFSEYKGATGSAA